MKTVTSEGTQEKRIVYQVPSKDQVKAQTKPKMRTANAGKWPLSRLTFTVRETTNADQLAKGIKHYLQMFALVTDDQGEAGASAIMSLPPADMLSEEYKVWNLVMVPLDLTEGEIPAEVEFEPGEAQVVVVQQKTRDGKLKLDDKGNPFAEVDQIYIGTPVTASGAPKCVVCGDPIPAGEDRHKVKRGLMCHQCHQDAQEPMN